MDPKTTQTLKVAVASLVLASTGLWAQGTANGGAANGGANNGAANSGAANASSPQDPKKEQGPKPLQELDRAPQRRPRRLLIDGVLGTIGDKAILQSSVSVELDAWIEGYTNKNGHPPSPQEWRARYIAILKKVENDEALAQAARSLPGTTRDRIDSIVDQWLAEEAREEEARAGSINKLRDKLGLLGQTFEGQQEERRTQRLGQLAVQQSLQARWRDQFALAVTPAEMRQYYDENIDKFIAEPSADLAVIVVRTGNDPAGALATAEKLAAAWRAAPTATAPDVARQFPGALALDPRTGVRNHPDDHNKPAIKQFAGDGKVGAVSAPIAMQGTIWILKVLRRIDGRNDRFDDPAVQARIQQILVNLRLEAEHNRLIIKSRKRFELRPLVQPGQRRGNTGGR